MRELFYVVKSGYFLHCFQFIALFRPISPLFLQYSSSRKGKNKGKLAQQVVMDHLDAALDMRREKQKINANFGDLYIFGSLVHF